jgi:O-antigen ligase
MFDKRDNSNISRHSSGLSPRAERLSSLLINVIDGALAGVIFVLPLIMGGRHPLGHLMLAALAVTAGLAWAVRQIFRPHPIWRPTWTMALVGGGIVLVALQSVPLPQAMLDLLAPSHAKLLPLWNNTPPDSASLGRWSTISFAPEETRRNLVLLISYGLLFFVAVHRIKAIEDAERLLQWCAISATCMAIFGLVQYIGGNGKFFWFYSPPFANTLEGAKGSFSNRNHFANFLALGVGPLIWWLLYSARGTKTRADCAVSEHAPGTQNAGAAPPSLAAASKRSGGQSRRRRSHGQGAFSISHMRGRVIFSAGVRGASAVELKTYILGLALAVVLFAGLMSLSRGGMAALVLASVVAATICCLASSAAGRFLGIMLAACLVIGAALSVFGLDDVATRLQTLTNGQGDRNEWSAGRMALWATVVRAIPDHFWLGSGAGSFNEVYPIYSRGGIDESIEFTHAENSYLQDLLETGVIGLGLTLACIVMCFKWCVAGWKGSERTRICAGGIAGALAATTAQALVDFVWFVPACTAIASILAACGLRVSQLAAPRGHRAKPPSMNRWAAAAVAIVLVPTGLWMINSAIGSAAAQPYWEQYLTALQATHPEQVRPDSQQPAEASAAGDADMAGESALIGCLENVIYWQPDHASAHLALAEAHLRLFDRLQANSPNPMTLIDVRSAATASCFPSTQSLSDWLARALGDNRLHIEAALRHAKQALSLCPLQGRAYVYLAKAGFVEGQAALPKQACIIQALGMRPFDGFVVTSAAAEALLDGDTRRWLDLSKQGFLCGPRYQRDLICNLVANVPAEGMQAMVDFIITQLQPDLDGLRSLYDACSQRGRSDLLEAICRYRAERAECEARNRSSDDALPLWLEAQQLRTQMRDGPKALECARCALECDSNNYYVRCQLASCLLDQGLFAEAEEQLHWCLQRSPGDISLENKLKQAIKGRLDAQRCAGAQTGGKVQ